MISKLSGVFLAIVFLITGSAVIHAQSASNAFKDMGNNDEPIQIEADKLEIIGTQNAALFTGNVNIVQGSTLLLAGKLTVSYEAEGSPSKTKSGIHKIMASNTVAISSGDNYVTAERATVDFIKEFVTLSGNVKMSKGLNFAAGCVVTIDLKTEVTNIKSCKHGADQVAISDTIDRPIVVFSPKSISKQ